jgi:antirestriction protein ArdC
MYYNEKTKRPYSGKNIEILEATGLKGGFMTFRQAIELGYKIPKGTKAIAKIIRPMEEFKEQADGSSKVQMSGRLFPVFHKSQLQEQSA